MELAAFFAGLFFFLWVLRSFGLQDVGAVLARAGLPAVAAALLFYPLICIWDVMAWQLLFTPQDSRRVRLGGLFWIRLAGEAVNNVTPFVDIGGEPLKAHWLTKRFGLPAPHAMASVVVARTSMFISEAAFMLAGAAFSSRMLVLPAHQRLELTALLFTVCFVFIGFLLLQRKGAFRSMNAEIGRFYLHHGGRFWSAVALDLIGWVFGGFETFFFCRLMRIEITLMQALVLESLLQLVRTGGFFVPMNLGVQEGGLAFFMNAMGFDPVAGVAVSLLKRFRQLFWTAAGFGVWGVWQYREAKKTTAMARGGILSFDTWLDRHIHRPPAQLLAFLLSKTPMAPNQVTVLSLVPAFLCCAFFSLGGFWTSVLALFFFYAWAVLDHADGSLARLKKMTSDWGQKLDDLCDMAASTLVLCGVFWGLEPVWNAHDRAVMARWFYTGIFLNVFSGSLLVYAKRRVRHLAIEKKIVRQSVLWKQKFLDKLTGRDTFYLFLLLVVFTQLEGPRWWPLYPFTMAILLGGLLVVSIASLWESARSGFDGGNESKG